MSGRIADWLPDEALVAPSVLATIDQCLADWSARWFGAREVQRDHPGGSQRISNSPVARGDWVRFADAIWIDWDSKASMTLALFALDHIAMAERLTTEDGRLLELLGKRIADDLATVLAGSVAPSRASLPKDPARGTVGFRLCSADLALTLELQVDASLLARLRKELCPPRRPAKSEGQSLAVPLAPIGLEFVIDLGTASVALAELEQLDPGDTIVLDHRLDQPLALHLAATDTTIATAQLVRADDHFTLIAS